MKHKKKTLGWLSTALFLVGCFLVLLPLGERVRQEQFHRNAIQTITEEVAEMSEAEVNQKLQDAQYYNDALAGRVTCNEMSLHALYENCLTMKDPPILGSLYIPAIDVNLPIYQGTDEDVLQNGVGHMEYTSLPVAGKGNHTVLTGHRGLPGSKLFTRLDELEEGDLFYITVFGVIQAYRIFDIQVMEPEDANAYAFQNQSEKELVSLITCTPYGINTHRLIVTGERIPYHEQEMTSIKRNVPSLRELAFYAIVPVFFMVFLVTRIRKKHNHRRCVFRKTPGFKEI